MLRSIAILFLLCSTAMSQTDSLGIDGPFDANPGQLVRLTADIEPAESPFWIVLSPMDLDYEQVEDGKRLLFSTGCRANQEIVVLLLAQRIDEGGRIVTRQLKQVVKVGSGQNDPVIDPAPEPDPNPDLMPESEFSKRIIEEVNKIRPPPQVLAQVSKNFFDIAQVASTYDSAKSLSIELSKRNTQAIGQADLSKWKPFGIVIQEEFQKRQLQTVAEYAPLLIEVSKSLLKVEQL